MFFKYGGHRWLQCPFYDFNVDNCWDWCQDVQDSRISSKLSPHSYERDIYLMGGRILVENFESTMLCKLDAIQQRRRIAGLEELQAWGAFV